jgi:hypothetical protein
MTQWPTANHGPWWLTLAPNTQMSGGKLWSPKTRRAAHRGAKMLRRAAVNVGKTQTALGAFDRRLAARVGQAQAVTATARKLAGLFSKTLRYGMASQEPGAAYDAAQDRQGVLHGLRRRAKTRGDDLMAIATVAGVS